MSLQYIQSTFLTFAQLSDLSGIMPDRLRELMKAGCLPGPAYRVVGECRISSFFGDHDETIELQYFPRSYVGKAKALEQSGLSLDMLSNREKQAFLTAYAEILADLKANSFGLGDLFSPDGCVGGEAAETHLEKEWQAYLDGTYGLCTRTGSVSDIATKEAMIAKIKFLVAKGVPADLDDLAQAVDLLDQVSADFAPHEVARSSREKYITAIRRQYLHGE